MKTKLTAEEYKRFLHWKKVCKKYQKKIERRKNNKRMNLFFNMFSGGLK